MMSDIQSEPHDEVYTLKQQDVLPVAKLFNQVGSSLTTLDSQSVDSKRVMNLDRDKVLPINIPPQQTNNNVPMQQDNNVPSATQKNTTIQQMVPANSTVVSMKDLERIQRIEKKLSTVTKKMSVLDKKLDAIDRLLNVPRGGKRFKISAGKTKCETSNINILLTTLADELQSGCSSITIELCK